MPLLAGVMLAGTGAFGAPAAPRATVRGIGPFTLQTRHGRAQVRLLRRERDLVWVMQKTRTGKFIETGIAVKDIKTFEIPTPKVLRAAALAKTPKQVQRVRAALGKLIGQLKPYRDLPGMVVDEAILAEAGLYEKEEKWDKALAGSEDILAQGYKPKEAATARLRAGLCHARLGQDEKALDFLDLATLTDDDLDLLSAVYFARGDAFAHLGRNDEAVLNYLYLVVFYPFVDDNEARCLAAVLPCYAALGDWEAAYKTTAVLRSQYKGTEYAARAEAFEKAHETELAKEGERQDTYEVTEFKEDKGVYDDFE